MASTLSRVLAGARIVNLDKFLNSRTQKTQKLRKERKKENQIDLGVFCGFCVTFAPFASGIWYWN
jgi:hypothetical protein